MRPYRPDELILYSGFHSETLNGLLEQCQNSHFPLAIVPPHGLWMSRLKLLPWKRIRLVHSDGSEKLIKNTSQTKIFPPTGAKLIFSTSGSTGGFKWVVLGEQGIHSTTQSLTRHLQIRSNDRIAIIPPPFHCFGAVIGLWMAKTIGAKISTLEKYDSQNWRKKLIDDRCTYLLAVPTILQDLLALGKLYARDLRGGIVGGAPVTRELFTRTRECLHVSEMTVGYGLTECGPAVTHTTPGDDLRCDFDIGKPLPNTQIISDPDKGAVVWGSQICLAFYGTQGIQLNPDRIFTGDHLEESKGNWIFRGRLADTLIRGAEKLALGEVDVELFNRFPNSEFLAFIVSDSRLGHQLGIAFRGGVKSNEIRSFIQERFGNFYIDCVIQKVPSFPRLPSGKITRNLEAIQPLITEGDPL